MSIRKVVNIIIGTINNIFGRNKDISSKRLDICNECENRRYIFKLGYVCNKCGCILKSKTTVENEVCPINKW